jgi:hypothetical protein
MGSPIAMATSEGSAINTASPGPDYNQLILRVQTDELQSRNRSFQLPDL